MTYSRVGLNFEKMVKWLFEQRNILIQFRNFSRYSVSPQGIRISLAFFNTVSDVNKLLAGILDYLEEDENGKN